MMLSYLVHLLELHGYGRESGHELIEPLACQPVVLSLLLVAQPRDFVEIGSTLQELFLALPVVLQDAQIGLGVLDLLCGNMSACS